ncbi:TLC domain-containing protein 4-B-like [Tubulanus polymorphus]|uniref:TLC domain-containing protein 4-B-like n=1 Tax=Tubulanus polymorphus TaxID=672921 RepID=UPI003DA6CB29
MSRAAAKMELNDAQPQRLQMDEVNYWHYCLYSVVGFICIYYVLSPCISGIICPGYKVLSVSKKVDWNARVMSTAHAIFVSFGCVYAFAVDRELSENILRSKSPIVYTVCATVIGYMVADLLIMLKHYESIGHSTYLLHHLASIYAYYFLMQYGLLSYFANFRLIAEFSTPFVNLRWFLSALGKPKSSVLFIVNAIMLGATFFLFRILVMPYFWYKAYSVYDDLADDVNKLYAVLIVTCSALDLTNIVWFYKICSLARNLLVTVDKNDNSLKAD